MKRLILVIYMLSMGSLCWAQAPSLGAASSFSVLGKAVTCTAPSVITGDVGATGVFTNTTGCIIAGGTPPATDAAATAALALTGPFLSAYNALAARPCTMPLTGTLSGVTLSPDFVYCFSAAATLTGTLTLDGTTNPSGIWIFQVPAAALTGTGFQVVMANGAQACNVYWAVGAAATLTDSLFQGNILAGSTGGAITITRGSLIGRALANGAVTLTSTNIHGSCALLAQGQAQGQASCTENDNDEHHHEKDKDRDDEKDKRKDHEKEQESDR